MALVVAGGLVVDAPGAVAVKMPKRCPNDATNDAKNDANDAKTMPERCQNNAKKEMASWQQFLCPKDTHTKNPKIARALSISPNPDAS